MNNDSKFYLFNFLVFLFIVLITQNIYSQQWVLAGNVPNPGLEPSISIVDGNNVWIAGGVPDTPRVFRTINGGINWDIIPTSGISNELYCIWATNSSTVFLGEGVFSGNAKLYKTTNAGLNWFSVIQTGQNEGFFNSMIFSRTNPLVGGALAEKIYITTNGGINWTQQSTGVVGVSSSQNSLMLIDANFYGFGLKNGAARIRATTNGGITWSNQVVNLQGSYTSGFAYRHDKLIGLSSTSASMPIVSRTTDGGNSWNQVNIGTGLSGNTFIKWVSGTDVVYIIGSNGNIKRSTNNGLNWVTVTTAGVTGITNFSFINLNNIIYGYAVSNTGSVLKLADSILILTGNINHNSERPSEYKLYQNYPNPFNPSTQIKFNISINGFVTLKVYNILGKEVATLVNENLQPGTYEIPFSINQFSNNQMASGIYFYKLETGYSTYIRKMTLVK